MLVVIQAIIIGVEGGRSFPTDEKTCVSCYTHGGVNCIDQEFSESHCCEYEPGSKALDSCMAKYRYCSYNLSHSRYRVFTCPPFNCPGAGGRPGFYMHQELGKEHIVQQEWSWLENAYNCKIAISASPHLNGKIIVETEKFGSAAYVYLQPNHFNEKYGTHGILENGMVYPVKKADGKQIYTVPTDWTIYIAYNLGMWGGKGVVRTIAEEYNDHDIDNLYKYWQPTGTSYTPSWERKR